MQRSPDIDWTVLDSLVLHINLPPYPRLTSVHSVIIEFQQMMELKCLWTALVWTEDIL